MKKAAAIAIGLSCVIGLVTWAAITVPRRRRENEMNQCLENLRRIDSAKRQWAYWTILQPDSPPGIWFEIIETNPIANRIPTPKEIASSLSGDNQMPHCPSGGTYTMGRVLDPPTCSVHDHDILRGPIGFEVQEGWTRYLV